MGFKKFIEPTLQKITFLIILTIILSIAIPYIALGTIPYSYKIESVNMVPAVEKGDIVIIEAIKFTELKTGDIILSKIEGQKIPIVHRVISINYEKGSLGAKGDANQYQLDIEKDISSSQILGREIFIFSQRAYTEIIIISWLIRLVIAYLLACWLSSILKRKR